MNYRNSNQTSKNTHAYFPFRLLGMLTLLTHWTALAEQLPNQDSSCTGIDPDCLLVDDDYLPLDKITCVLIHLGFAYEVEEQIEKTINKYGLESVNSQCYSTCEDEYESIDLKEKCDSACDLAMEQSTVAPLTNNSFALLSQCSCNQIAEIFSQDSSHEEAVRYGYQAYACLFNYSYYAGLDIDPPAELAPATNCSDPMPIVCLEPPAPTPSPTAEPTSNPTVNPSGGPTRKPSAEPTETPSGAPTTQDQNPNSEGGKDEHHQKFDDKLFYQTFFPVAGFACFIYLYYNYLYGCASQSKDNARLVTPCCFYSSANADSTNKEALMENAEVATFK